MASVDQQTQLLRRTNTTPQHSTAQPGGYLSCMGYELPGKDWTRIYSFL